MAGSEPWLVQEDSLPLYAGPSRRFKVVNEFHAGCKVRGNVVELNGHTWLEVEDPRGPRFFLFDGEELKRAPAEDNDLAIMTLDDDREDLTLDECLRLQHGLIRRYMSGDFQRELWRTYEVVDGGNPDQEVVWLRKRRALLQQEQFPIIEQYGFPPTPEGVLEMSKAFTLPIRTHPKITENRLLIWYLTLPGMQQEVADGKVPAPRGVLWSRWQRPNPEEWSKTYGCKVWLVVGGANSGGIVVRSGPNTTSPICRSRLEADSLVEELDRCENRIKYALMDGAGPEFGWVSVSCASGALLSPAFSELKPQDETEEEEYFRVVHKRVPQRADPDLTSLMVGVKRWNDVVKGFVIKVGDLEWLQVRSRIGLSFMLIDGSTSGLPVLLRRLTDGEKDKWQKKIKRKGVSLTLEEILKMHERHIRGFMSDNFQRAIWQAFEQHGDHGQRDFSDLEWAEAKAKVCSQVQYPIIKDFGFEESYKGVFKSIKAVPAELSSHPRITENRLLMRYLVEPYFQLEVMEGQRPVPKGVPETRVKNPNPDDWPAGSGKVWTVVGGEEKGGITVRKEESTQSQVLGAKLETDSIVEQLEREHNRVKYKLCRGAGPEIGWVSITYGGKLLLAPAHASLASGDANAVEQWCVVHSHVVQRSKPSTDSDPVGLLKQGARIKGAVIEKDLVQWLEVLGPCGLSYVLIDGASLGLGILLVKVPNTEIVLHKGEVPEEPQNLMESQEVQFTLSLDDAIRMLNSLIVGFMTDSFQRLIWQEYFRFGGNSDMDLKWLRARDAACQSVLYPILEEFGFEASKSGVTASTLAITREMREVPAVKERVLLRKYLCDPGLQKEVAMERMPVPRGVPRSRMHQPFPDDWAPGTGKVWLVIGGADAGGIIVRKSPSLDSNPLILKLATNSLIEELERQGSRIRYWRMDGSGPDYGWVSMTTDGKALLEPYLGHGGCDSPMEKVWIVVEKMVRERAEPSIESEYVGLQPKGAKLHGIVVEKDGLKWLELSGRKTRYVLIDGTSLGLGVLLKPSEAAPLAIEDDPDMADLWPQ